ncbi:F-box/WD repeat-containing protein 9-like [Copidosoma floridanum]|uniref:F-box/WD repeat-containing protein 9-like n=1 Tax=Copidosoma floridanum TaxID=29053 RepID=UPI0006C994BD|nr:F-box/WD repeat-containing protein 9-like [Copidosoma floridanum]
MCDAEAVAPVVSAHTTLDELDDASGVLFDKTSHQEVSFNDSDDKTSGSCSNSSVSCGDDDESTCGISLLDLPVEVFLHICSFLDASTLVHSLSLTCKQFHMILTDNSIWKVRISKVCQNATYPILPSIDKDELFWKLSCVALERQAKLWRNKDIMMEKLLLSNVHYSAIDGLKLMHGGQICISGGRDRSLVISKLSEEGGQIGSTAVADAHDGWIWDLTAIKDTVYSCSWDRCVKEWLLTNSGLQPVVTYETIVVGALLCVTSCSELGLFATGSYCKNIVVFDSRSGYKPIANYQPHHRAVIRLAMNSNYIISASEDKTVNIWDHRTRKSITSVMISKDSFPMSLCIQKNLVYVGDSCANLHILDAKQDFERVKSYKTEHEKKITGVYVDAGCLITSSLDRNVHISSPTDPLQSMATLKYSNGEISSIDYLNEVLAISGTDVIEIWRPK